MPRPDSLNAIVAELGALSASDRKAVLAALTPEERDRLHSARADGPFEPEGGDAGTARRHSTWFESLVAAARSDDASIDVTRSARSALAAVMDGGNDAIPARPTPPPGRTLLQAAGGLLSQVKR